MPDSESRNYFRNIVTGLNNVQKQITLFQQQAATNLRLARATAVANANLRQQNAALRSQVASLKNSSRAIQENTKHAQFMTITWAGVARVIVGSVVSRGIQELINAITTATQKTREFVIRIGEIRTISQNSQQAFEAWAQSVRNLSDSWGFSILDTAEAAYETLSNQIAEGAQTTIFLSEASRLARIGVGELSDAVNTLSSIINAYNLDASAARRISDELFVAIDLGRFRLQDLGDSYGNVAILASQLNISNTELLAGMTVLTRKGVNVSTAMTLLRNVMINLIRPTEEMTKWLKDEFGASSAEAALRAEGLIGIIDKLIQITEQSQNPMSDFAELFGRIRGVVGAAGLATVDYRKDLEELNRAHEKAAVAAEEMAQNIGVRSVIAMQKLKNIFTVDIGRSIQKTFVALNDAVGSLAERLKDFLDILKVVVNLFKGIALVYMTRIVSQTIVWYKNLKYVVITQSALNAALGMQNVELTGAAALTQILRTRFIALGALLGTWQAAVVAVGIAIGGVIYMHRRNQEKLHRTIEDNITSEIILYRQMIDEKIAEDIRHFEAKQELALSVFRLIEREAEKNVNAIQKNINKQMELRDTIFNYDRMLYKIQLAKLEGTKEEVKYNRILKTLKGDIMVLGQPRREGGPDYFGMAKLTIEQLNKELKVLRRDWAGLSAKDQEKELRQILGLVDELQSYHGKWAYHSGIIKTKQGEILDLNLRGRRVQVDVNKQVDYYRRQIENLAKTQRDIAQEQLNQEIALNKNLSTLNKQLDIAKQDRDLAKQSREEAETKAKETAEAFRGQKASLSELLQKAKELQNILPTGGVTEGLTTWGQAQAKLIQSQLEAFVTEAERLAKLDVIPSVDLAKLRLTLVGIMREINTAITSEDIGMGERLSSRINENYRIILNQLQVQFSKFAQNAEKASELVGAWQPFLDAALQLNDKVLTLQEAVKAFQDSLKSTMDSGAQSTQNWINNLDQVLARLIAINRERANQTKVSGGFLTRAAGGSVGKDSVPILASPGEFILNEKATRKFLPQLIAMNSGSRRFETGGVTNNNIGDINVSVSSSGNSSVDARNIAAELRRELRRSTVRLN